jgi:uncharacterized repeat protein (TIGR01451 family)
VESASSEIEVAAGDTITLEVWITAGPSGLQGYSFGVDYSGIVGAATLNYFVNEAPDMVIFPLTLGETADDGVRVNNINGTALPPFAGTGLAPGQDFLAATLEFHVNTPPVGIGDVTASVLPSSVESIVALDGSVITGTTTFNSAQVYSSVPPVPVPTITKSDTLESDEDGDGMADPGDTVHYVVSIENGSAEHTGVVFSDTPDANSTLVAGSVTADGTVTVGNVVGDTSVEVDLGTLAADATATIEFDVVVNSPFPGGLGEISNQGALSADGFGPIPSDDPDTTEELDATLTPIVDVDIDICESDLETCEVDLGTCEGDLGTCTSDLSTAQGDLATCQGDLGACGSDLDACLQDPPFEDADGDGIHDDNDACAGTPAGEPVDGVGCSLAQFCGSYDVAGNSRNSPCNQADWGNDEPLGAEDCKARGDVCEPR